MQIAKQLAGFSGAKADDLRKAIGKKNREAMAKLEPEFREGCRASGTREQVIEQLWTTNDKSADYSFNRSHAACYALIAYRTAWLKANHPAEYMAALISSVMSTKDKVPFFATQAEQMGIEILPPDVNVSDHHFVVVERQHPLRPGRRQGRRLRGRRGDQDARARRAARLSRCGTSARASTAARSTRRRSRRSSSAARSAPRARRARACSTVLEQAQGAGQKAQQDLEIGQGSIFDSLDFDGGSTNGNGAAAAFAAPEHPPIPAEEFDQPELLAIEKESIGLFISAHPLKQVREALREVVDCSLADLQQRKDKDWVSAGGIITAAQEDPHAQRRARCVRDARRPRGLGRDPRLRQGAGGVRGRARRRLRRRRARPRRPQGRRQDVPRRAVRRAVRADARGGRAREGRRGDADHRPAPAAAAPRRRRALRRRRSSTTSSTCWRTSPASREVHLELQMSAGEQRTLSSARPFGSRRRRRCAPSSSTSSGRRR